MDIKSEQWFSVEGQIIDISSVFNIDTFNGSARYEKNYQCSYCHGSGRHRVRYANSTGTCTACSGTGKQGTLIKECYTLKALFKKNYIAAQKVVNSTAWLQSKMEKLTDIEKKIITDSDKNPFLKSLALTIRSGRPLSRKQISIAERILSEVH